MSAEARSLSEHDGPRVLAEIGTVYVRRGHELRVTVKEGSSGHPGINVREFITAEAYSVESSRIRVHKGAGSRKQREQYVGPGKQGLWIGPNALEELMTVLADAYVKALELEEGDR